MSYWLTDPELFLYAKGSDSDDVHLWRCKKTVSSSSSVVVPMKPGNIVKDHLELIGNMFDWDETDYKRLVKYISERRLLVNSQGLVIAELHKVDKDGNKMMDDAKVEVPPIYIRSLDVLSLKPYIPMLREQPIPLRTVGYLEDVDGKAAVMEDDDDSNLAKRVADLELKNKTLKGKVTKSNADLATRTSELANSQYQLNRFKKAYMEDLEVWMNHNIDDGMYGIEKLSIENLEFDSVTVGGQGYPGEGLNTNVHARYWYNVKGQYGPNDYFFEAVCIDDLNPNKERARFSQGWNVCTIQGKKYVARCSCTDVTP